MSATNVAVREVGLTRARLTQLMNLLLLAPEIQGRIVMENLILSERALRRAVSEPAWTAQATIVEVSVGDTQP